VNGSLSRAPGGGNDRFLFVKILFIHEVNYRSKVVFEMHEFPELLAARGHEVTFYHFPEGEHTVSPNSWAIRTAVTHIPGRAHPDQRIRLITPPHVGGRPTERVLAPVLNAPSLWHLITSGKFDAIVSYSVPTTGWQAVYFAKRANVPFLFRAIDISHSLRKTRFGPLIKRAERYVYEHADLVSANNPALLAYCRENGAPDDRLVINLPPLDTEHFSPGPKNPELLRRLGIAESDKVILFMGTLFRFAGLADVMKTLRPSLKTRRDLRLVILGDGEDREHLHALRASLDLQNEVVFTGRIEYEDLPEYLRLADVAINPFEHSLTTDCALPHKVLQYLAVGIPTVSTDLAGLIGVVGEGNGVQFEVSPSLVADVSLKLLNGGNLEQQSNEARRFAEVHLSPSVCVKSFESQIRRMCVLRTD
jgi:glycosyltransferase involved in cell wall biosynthesis